MQKIRFYIFNINDLQEVVDPEGETSSHLFKILEEWNLILQGTTVDLVG